MEQYLEMKTVIVELRMTEGRDIQPEKFRVEVSWPLYFDLEETLRTIERVPSYELHFVRILESLAIVSVLDIQTVGRHLHSAILTDNWPLGMVADLGRFFASWKVCINVIKAVMKPDGIRWREQDENFHIKWIDSFLRPFALGAHKDAEKFTALALHIGLPKLANLVHTEHILAADSYTYKTVRDTLRHCLDHITKMRQQHTDGNITHRLKCPYCNETVLYYGSFKHVMDIHSVAFKVNGQQCGKCHQPVRGPFAVSDPPGTYHASVCPFMECSLFDSLMAPGSRLYPHQLPFYRKFLRVTFGERDMIGLSFEPRGDKAYDIRSGWRAF